MAAVKGKKGRIPNIHLLQEPQAGARPPSTFCSARALGFVGGLSDWVGSSNSTSPFQRQGHDSNIKPAFFNLFFFNVSALVASNCLDLYLYATTAEGQ